MKIQRWMAGMCVAISLGGMSVGLRSLTHAEEKGPVETSAPATAQVATPEPLIQMAILLDTSNSMDGLINQARAQLWKVVNEFALARRQGQRPQLQVALFEYGNDSLPANEGHIRLVLPLTDDLDKVSEALFALTTNGGNEYCGQVIQSALDRLQWSNSKDALKCIFIAGNEEFTQGTVDYAKSCKAAIAQGITVNTIFCGAEAEGVNTKWMDGAKLADGDFMSINQEAVVAAISTPQDKPLAELSSQLNTTYIPYGNSKQRAEAVERQTAQDDNANNLSAATNASRAQFKASALYCNTQWDLVDALQHKKVKLEDLKPEELPEEMRKLTPAQCKTYVEQKTQQRVALQNKIQELSQTREKFIAEARQKEAGQANEKTLDSAIIQAVRNQASRQQYEFAKPTPAAAPASQPVSPNQN